MIDQKISQVYQKGVVNKILQSMDRIRNEFDPVQARRWPTGLLQNARDLAYPNRPVRVQIELTDDAVYFRHSGKPFSVKDILSIVNQVSSKQPGEGVGQFGTGFMSTFQLSMKVGVRSLLKDENEPYKTFHICLDRSGATHEAISQALESLKAADQGPPVEELDEDAFNTEFCDHLDNRRSREIARIGVEDLRGTLAFIMLFSDRLGEAELLLREDGVALTAEWDPGRGFLPLPPGTPRLFIDFPMVGSERFPSRSCSTACPFGPTSPAAASLWWNMSNPWMPGEIGPSWIGRYPSTGASSAPCMLWTPGAQSIWPPFRLRRRTRSGPPPGCADTSMTACTLFWPGKSCCPWERSARRSVSGGCTSSGERIPRSARPWRSSAPKFGVCWSRRGRRTGMALPMKKCGTRRGDFCWPPGRTEICTGWPRDLPEWEDCSSLPQSEGLIHDIIALAVKIISAIAQADDDFLRCVVKFLLIPNAQDVHTVFVYRIFHTGLLSQFYRFFAKFYPTSEYVPSPCS